MENTKDEKQVMNNDFKYNKMPNKNNKNSLEKIGVICLIILALILIYFSLFFIHDIIDRKSVKDTKSTIIDYPGNNTTDNTNNVNDGNGIEGENIVDINDVFRILEGTTNWNELKYLSIFNNSFFHGQAKIAPGVYGSYNFIVENLSDSKMKYDITFDHDNPYKINMKYKLKLNGNYVAGDESNWITCSEMNQSNRIINGVSKDLYTIEWIWEDAPNDTEIGETEGANYILKVKAYVEEAK